MWKIVYLPTGEKPKEDGMTFKTEKEAWDYLREATDNCPDKIPMPDGSKGCQACMAEFDVVKIKYTTFTHY